MGITARARGAGSRDAGSLSPCVGATEEGSDAGGLTAEMLSLFLREVRVRVRVRARARARARVRIRVWVIGLGLGLGYGYGYR